MALTNTQYDAIIRDYNQKQFNNRHQQEARIKEVYEQSDVFQKIDNEISSLSVQQARKLLSGDDKALAQLKEEITKLSALRIRCLEKLGYPADYLEMQYTCPDCQDTGYADNHKCHCFKKAAIEMIYTQSNLTNILERENFSHLTFDYYSADVINPSTGLTALETAKKAVFECRQFIEHFDEKFENLFFYGDTGVGKTFLSNCIAKELIDSCHSVLYFTAFDLFETFAKSVFSRNNFGESTDPYIFESDLLIIDDLGTELTNSFTSSQLFLCINERMLRKKSTIISTNLPIHTFSETYSERTFSRISSNYNMIKLIGDDIRIRKKLSGKKLDQSRS